jgi:hypothetical protein
VYSKSLLPRVFPIIWRRSGFGIKRIEAVEVIYRDDLFETKPSRIIRQTSYQIWFDGKVIDRALTKKSALRRTRAFEQEGPLFAIKL